MRTPKEVKKDIMDGLQEAKEHSKKTHAAFFGTDVNDWKNDAEDPDEWEVVDDNFLAKLKTNISLYESRKKHWYWRAWFKVEELTSAWYWLDLKGRFTRKFFRKHNRAHFYSDLPDSSWNCFDNALESAIPKWFLRDWPNYIEHAPEVEKALWEAREWFETYRPIEKAKLDEYEMLWHSWPTREDARENMLKYSDLYQKFYDEDTKHLCTIMKYRSEVTD